MTYHHPNSPSSPPADRERAAAIRAGDYDAERIEAAFKAISAALEMLQDLMPPQSFWGLVATVCDAADDTLHDLNRRLDEYGAIGQVAVDVSMMTRWRRYVEAEKPSRTVTWSAEQFGQAADRADRKAGA